MPVVPYPRPPSSTGWERKSPIEAQSGRVRMYAIQNDRTALAPIRHASAVPTSSSTDVPGPHAAIPRVQLPTAVPSAKVTRTAAQLHNSRVRLVLL